MPNFDRTGPNGSGPMTGWGRGRCGGRRGAAATPAVAGPGRGRRRRGRWGFGPGGWFDDGADLAPAAAPAPAGDEAADPEARRAVLKAERNRLKVRLDEVEEVLRSIGRSLRGEAKD